uniref:C6 domain-containing protein n=1 Tax=Caenorhabditis tropicalis TaxID=1561998 RepID=A0A1I7U8N5_9PELO
MQLQQLQKLHFVWNAFALNILTNIGNSLISACSTCTDIYNTGCQGTGIPSATDWCVKEEDVPVTYTLGATEYLYGEETCSSILSCPSGTVSYFLYEGIDLLGNMGGVDPTTAYCAESGSEAGVWYADIDAHPYEITQMTCRPY